MDINALIEENLNKFAQRIVSKGEMSDEMALGELTFYMALRRVLAGKATPQDIGLFDAINDTLQALGHLEKGQTFYK